MTTAIMAPWAKDEVTRLGAKTFKKEILKFGHIKVDDEEFDFTPEFGAQMVDAFQAGVMPTVTLQLADENNKHTQAVDRAGGEIIGLELSNDGLSGIISADDKTAELINRYPRMGVSVRALQNRMDNTGKVWPAVLNHVLATFDPVVERMGNWEPIELSREVTRVINLANPVGTDKEDTEMPQTVGDLSTDEARQLHTLLGKMLGSTEVTSETTPNDKPDGGGVDNPETGGDAPGTVEDPTGSGQQPETDEDTSTDRSEVPDEEPLDLSTLTDEELEALLMQDAEEHEPENPQPAGGSVDTGASTETAIAASRPGDDGALELARARQDEQAIELARMREELDVKNYESERERLARESGLPPRIIDLARDVLQGSGHTLELSRGGKTETVDAGHVVRSLITEIGKVTKALDLSHPAGFAMENDEDETEKTERDEFVKLAKTQFGL